MIIDNIHQLEFFKGKTVFLYPITKDNRLHKHCNPVIGFVLVDTNTKQTYTLSTSHPEGIFNHSSLDFLKDSIVYCYDTATLRYQGYNVDNYIDTQIQYYLYTNKGYELELPNLINQYTRQFTNCLRINELVAISKHEEIALSVYEEIFVKDKQPGLDFYQNQLLPLFYHIESQGIGIDEELFLTRFGQTFSKDGQLCYTQYNYYTTTGRPSNRFDGINFAALNKEDNTRDCFISRNGILAEIDFNSYHPRLIASIIGYDFGSDNVYEHLASYYKETPAKSKELTFRQLYGGIQKQYIQIPFFQATNNLAQMLWKEANEKGYIESPISGRQLQLENYTDLNPNILFNYFIQMYETEHNVVLLTNLFKFLDKDIQPILYTYDSILFDLPENKIQTLQKALDEAIPSNFPYKLKTGPNYSCLQ